MDKKRSILNVSVSIGFKIILMAMNIFVRRYLIACVGNEINGLNSLYLSVIGFLSVAELGIGSAISFSMYKPIVEGDTRKVTALFCLFKQLYAIVGCIILVVGLALIPFLPKLACDYTDVSVNMGLTFALMLISVVLSYGYSSKISLFNAYKNNYISTTIDFSGMLLQYVLQIIVLIIWRSYTAYLWCKILSVLFQWALTNVVARRMHSDIIYNKESLDIDTKKEVSHNIKALFIHRVGGALVNTVDSIVISAFVGVISLGKYSNYTLIMSSMVTVLLLVFTPLTSIIGHLFVQKEKEEFYKYFHFFHMVNFILGCVFFLGYYAVIDDVIYLCFGNNLELSKNISFIITLNYFIQFMTKSVRLFRDATGVFYNDRYKPMIEGMINVVLSVMFVKLFQAWWGDEFAMVGVIVATIITSLTICHTVEPFVFFKHGLHMPVKMFYIKNYSLIALFTISLFIMKEIWLSIDNHINSLLINGFISVGISFSVVVVIMLLDKQAFGYLVQLLKKRRKIS